MKNTRRSLKKIFSEYNILCMFIVGLVSFVVLTIISYRLNFQIVSLNENQVLYITTTLAGVLSSLFGLIIAGYALNDTKLQRKLDNDLNDEFEEIINNRRKYNEKGIAQLTVTLFITILITLYTLIVFKDVTSFYFYISINITVLISILEIALILWWSNSLISTKKDEQNTLSTVSKILHDMNVEQELLKADEKNDVGIKFEEFLMNYNNMEYLIITTSKKIIGEKSVKANASIQMRDAMYILVKYEIINYTIKEIIDTVRRYRNATVHSTEIQSVDETISNYINLLICFFEVVYNLDKDSENFRNEVAQLLDDLVCQMREI